MDIHVQELPGTTAESGSMRPQYSVSNLVENVHRLQKLCWHVVLLWKIAVYLIRWESPLVTLSFWVTSLLFCYFTESIQILVSCVSLLLILAGAGGLANLNHQEIQKQQPSTSKPQPGNGPSTTVKPQPTSGPNAAVVNSPAHGDDHQNPVDTDHLQKQGREILTEYRQLMLLTQDCLRTCCNVMQRIHAVLQWQDTVWSPVFYGGSLVSIVILHLLPLRWFVMATISSILCINQSFVVLLLQVYDAVKVDNVSQSIDNNNEDERADEDEYDDHAVLSNKESQEKAPRYEVKPRPPPPIIEHRPLHLCLKSKSLDEASPNFAKVAAANRSRSSTAPELPIVKLNAAGPDEVCYTCKAACVSAPKRRRYCRSCGNQFCHRCCSRKLPRSVFGATSPAAQTEKVFVCNSCFCALTAEDLCTSTQSTAAGGATIEEC